MCAKPKIFTRWVSTSWVFFWWSPNTGTRQRWCCVNQDAVTLVLAGDVPVMMRSPVYLTWNAMSMRKMRYAAIIAWKCSFPTLQLLPECGIRLFHGSSNNWYFKNFSLKLCFFSDHRLDHRKFLMAQSSHFCNPICMSATWIRFQVLLGLPWIVTARWVHFWTFLLWPCATYEILSTNTISIVRASSIFR